MTYLIREKFIKSTAAFSVITYLLGIGDRHLDNIMVTKDGTLFHIDFSFCIGHDPKPFYPSIRITKEMIENWLLVNWLIVFLLKRNYNIYSN